MRVLVDNQVNVVLREFYKKAMENHITLTRETVHAKINRVRSQLHSLGDYPSKYGFAEYKLDWKRNHYRVFVVEDIHFAYKVIKLRSGEEVVYVIDACHSLLYHD
mgnify:CR=1 FL=1